MYSLCWFLLVANVAHSTFTAFLTFSFLTFHRATVKKGVTFRTATPSNSLLWDITLDMGTDGAIAVICQRKAPIPGKRQVCVICEWVLAKKCNIHFYNGLKLLMSDLSNNTPNGPKGVFHIKLVVPRAVEAALLWHIPCKIYQYLSVHLLRAVWQQLTAEAYCAVSSEDSRLLSKVGCRCPHKADSCKQLLLFSL